MMFAALAVLWYIRLACRRVHSALLYGVLLLSGGSSSNFSFFLNAMNNTVWGC